MVFDTNKVCGGSSSCSVKIQLADGSFTYEDGKPGVDPIYIRTSEQSDMLALVDTLAHETFHRTQPFGPVGDTRFEEYWAFRIENHINAEPWLTFGAYDPLDPNHLNMWIRENKFNPYLEFPEYPASVENLVIRPNPTTNGGSSVNPAAAYAPD